MCSLSKFSGNVSFWGECLDCELNDSSELKFSGLMADWLGIKYEGLLVSCLGYVDDFPLSSTWERFI